MKPCLQRAVFLGSIYVILIVFIIVFLTGFTGGTIVGGLFEVTGAERTGVIKWIFTLYGPDIAIIYFWSFIPTLFAVFIPRLIKNKKEAAILYVMALNSCLIPTYWSGIYPAFNWFAGGYVSDPTLATWLIKDGNPILAPTHPLAYLGFWYGGTTVPWRSWFLPILFWIAFFSSEYLFAISFSAIILKPAYIDEESLPFPMATGATEIINLDLASPGYLSLLSRNRWLFIGIAVGVIASSSYWLHFILPSVGISPLLVDFTPYAFIPWAPLVLMFDPFVIGGAYFIPLEVLFSGVLFFLILYIILPAVLTSLGIYGPFLPGQSWIWNAFMRLNDGNTGAAGWLNWGQYTYGYRSIFFGALIGYVLFPLFRMRSVIWRNIKREWEKKGFSTYKFFMILAVISFFIHSLIISIGIGIDSYPLWWSILFQALVAVIYVMGSSRVRGEIGSFGLFTSFNQGYMEVVYYRWPLLSEQSPISSLIRNNPRALNSSGVILWGAGPLYLSPTACAAPRLLEAFKICKRFQVDDKTILIAATISALIPILITPPLHLILCYHFGILNKYSMSGALAEAGSWVGAFAGWIGERPAITSWTPSPPRETVHIFEALGFLLVVAIYLLRLKTVRLRMLHPAGIIAAVAFGPVSFFPWIIALLAKWLTFHVWGVETHERKGVPFATGLILGFSIIVFICAFYWSIIHSLG